MASRLAPRVVVLALLTTMIAAPVLAEAQEDPEGDPPSPASNVSPSVSGCPSCPRADAGRPQTTSLPPTPAATATAAAPTAPPTSGKLFDGQILVYTTHAFPHPGITSMTALTQVPVVPVTTSEQLLASGRPGYPEIAVDVLLADPGSYAAAAGVPALAAAMRSGAVLATQEATLRHAHVGSMLTLHNGRTVTVSAIVDAHQIGGHEMAASPAILPPAPADRPNYLLVGGHLTTAAVKAAAARAFPSLNVRVATGTANGYLSATDSVLTQLETKVRFGEFSFRPATQSATAIIPDPTWVHRQLITSDIPQLGSVTCNRAVMTALRAAMVELTARALGSLVDTADFRREGGCWSPRATRAIEAGLLSSHSWGIAVDINVAANPLGGRPRQDPRLIAIMAKHGFAWGGRFLRADGAHFQWVGDLAG